MDNFQIKVPKGATKSRKRVGRGIGSGMGSTSTRGNNGQNARSGGGVRPGFEGGQMPLFRRVARRGFSNYPFKKEYMVINLTELDGRFADGDTVSLETLKEKGIVKRKENRVKILGQGTVTKKLNIQIAEISESARDKILKAGGTVPEKLKAADDKPEPKARVKKAESASNATSEDADSKNGKVE